MKIKIFVGISILCFFIITSSILTSFLIIKDRSKGSIFQNSSNFTQRVDNLQVADSSGTNTNGAQTPEPNTTIVTTAVDASTHKTATDCWIIISGKIYDVTSFLSSHPGGSHVITPYCGKDATQAYNTKDENPPNKHTAFALQILAQYFVANVGDKITTVVKNVTSQVPGATITPTSQNNLGGLVITKTPTPTIKPVASTPIPTSPPLTTSSTTLSTAEVANHNTTSNCWLIISNNVYNVSSYIVQHPGGVSAIQPYCGKEATQAFQTKGGRGSNHSATAYNLLNGFLVGSIGSVITTSNGGGTTTPTSAPTTAPTGGGGGTTTPTTTPTSNNNSLIPASVSAKYPGATLKSIEDNHLEMEILYNGSCRHIQVNSSGAITSDQSC